MDKYTNKKGHKSLPIMDVKINNEIPWGKINFKKICAGYNKAKFFIFTKIILKIYTRKNGIIFSI